MGKQTQHRGPSLALLQALPQTRCVSSTVSQTDIRVVRSGPDALPVQDQTWGDDPGRFL